MGVGTSGEGQTTTRGLVLWFGARARGIRALFRRPNAPTCLRGSGGQRNTSASACDGVLKPLSRTQLRPRPDVVEVGVG